MPTQTRLTKLSRSVADQVVLVTGAASGMGRATAHLLADEGARVGLVDRDAENLARVAEEIAGAGGTAHAVATDVAAPGAPAAAVAEVREALGPLDGLVNNAGTVAPASVTAEAGFEEAWERTLAVNLAAQSAFVRAALPDLGRRNAGRIVNVASTEGLGATAGIAAYTVSKHGVIGLTRSLAVELGPLGITVNCICPGPINTALTADIPDADKAVFARRRTAVRRYGEPEEVAHATFAFLLPAASFTTGAVLVVDGGLMVRNA